jgi:hypothetical protein
LTLKQIMAHSIEISGAPAKHIEQPQERFHSVINFPNFLLQVLRVLTQQDVPLDDKRLLDAFEKYLPQLGDNRIEAVKEFAYQLLFCRYLLDHFVVKREFSEGDKDGSWSLKRYQWSASPTDKQWRGRYDNAFGSSDENIGVNRPIRMLLSAFHVSTPTQSYKHWLNAVLRYLWTTSWQEEEEEGWPIDPTRYLRHLESIAKAFVFDRYLKSDGGLDYHDIIYVNQGVCQTSNEDLSDADMSKSLSYTGIQNNLVFNYLDYLLWLRNRAAPDKDPKIDDYEFTFRSSVEHIYPRQPKSDPLLPEKIRDSFGNLCLISHSKNSELSNYGFDAKKEHYKHSKMDSIKQYRIMKNRTWGDAEIVWHERAMMAVLRSALETGDGSF